MRWFFNPLTGDIQATAPIPPARWTDLIGNVEHAAGLAGMTRETLRDTPTNLYWFRRDQKDALDLRYQLPHGWDRTRVEPHIHFVPAGAGAGDLVLDGYYVWIAVGQPVPELAGWIAFTKTIPIAAGDLYIARAVNLFETTPPPAKAVPSAELWIYLRRNTDVDTYQGAKAVGTAAANVGLTFLDMHFRVIDTGTASTFGPF